MTQLEALFCGIRAVVFDFDGVILESCHIKTEAFLELFADYPEHQEAVLQFHLQNVGVSRYVKFQYVYEALLARPYSDQDGEQLGAAFSALVVDKVLRCPFVPGAFETLQAMQGHMPAFVASGTPQEELEFIVAERGLNSYFTEVWGTPRNKAAIIQDILHRYGCMPSEVMMVGDGLSDYQAAQATGTHFVARETPDQSWKNVPVICLPDLQEMPRSLGLLRQVAL